MRHPDRARAGHHPGTDLVLDDHGSAGPALLLTIVLVPLTIMDNFLKPMLMGRGLTTPTVVIFLGVVGGVLTYGFIGIFLGPVILAVLYYLVLTWTLFASSPEDELRDDSSIQPVNKADLPGP